MAARSSGVEKPLKKGGQPPLGRPTQGLAGTVLRNGSSFRYPRCYFKTWSFVSEVVPYAATSPSFWPRSVVCGALLHVGATWVLSCWLFWVVPPGLSRLGCVACSGHLRSVRFCLRACGSQAQCRLQFSLRQLPCCCWPRLCLRACGFPALSRLLFLLPYILRQTPYRWPRLCLRACRFQTLYRLRFCLRQFFHPDQEVYFKTRFSQYPNVVFSVWTPAVMSELDIPIFHQAASTPSLFHALSQYCAIETRVFIKFVCPPFARCDGDLSSNWYCRQLL